MKKFFGKIINYIKNTAWIQPLLIVCVIFLILFLLQPIANGIGSIVSCIGDKNSMTEISYKEYTEKVTASQKGTDSDPIEFIVVFTQDTCEHCKSIKPYINHYVKKNKDVTIYNVDVTFNSKKHRFNDKTIKGSTVHDGLGQLDARINEYYQANPSKNSVNAEPDLSSELVLLGTPTFIWYVNGLEVRIDVNPDTPENNASFSEWIKFPKVEDYADWSEPFVASKLLNN